MHVPPFTEGRRGLHHSEERVPRCTVRVSWSIYLRPPTLHDKTPHYQPCLPRPPQARLSVAEVRQPGGQASRQAGPVSWQRGKEGHGPVGRREARGRDRDANPRQSSRLADHEHRILIGRAHRSQTDRCPDPPTPIIEPSSSRASGGGGGGGGAYHRGTSVELQDLAPYSQHGRQTRKKPPCW